MPDPRVVVVMRQFKIDLLAREQTQMQEMARRWLETERRLDAQIQVLAQELADMRAAGEPVAAWRVYELDRYRSLLVQGRDEFRRYAVYATDVIAQGQRDLAALGLDQAGAALDAAYQEYGLQMSFNRLPLEATEYMVGSTREGMPLGDLLRQRMVGENIEAWQRLTQTLIDGTALGWNPRKTARAMANDLAGGLDKALTIARSEQMRVYRMAGNEQYLASGVVSGVKRLTAHDDRVCVACLADDGVIYDIGTLIDDHANGRCTAVPVCEGLPEVSWQAGEDWLNGQGEDVQRAILGPGRFDLWSSGRVPLSAMGTQHVDETWGASPSLVPVSMLAGAVSLLAGD